MSKVDVLVDLQFGSTGKGALAGYLGARNEYTAVVSCNMPNAGHSAYSPDNGKLFVHKVLPSAIFGDHLRVVGVGPGAIFSIDRLEEEWQNVCAYRDDLTLVIHEAAGILTPEHREKEQATLSRISSTMQGSGEALISKIRREENAIAKHRGMAIFDRLNRHGRARIVDQAEWLYLFGQHDEILLEGSQGYSLGLSAGFYPYCTSRDCTPARVISDCSMPVGWLRDVYGSCRVHPIRVGNTPDGHSGGWYDDQREIHFSDLGVKEELTTVTQRVRRIATFSEIQIEEAMQMALPRFVFLNFANYDSGEAQRVRELIDGIADVIGCGGVSFIGHGPKPSDIEEV
jgi:adenylosuccinate synthase